MYGNERSNFSKKVSLPPYIFLSVEKFDNMPEGLQESERGEQLQEAVEALEMACDSLDEVIEGLGEII